MSEFDKTIWVCGVLALLSIGLVAVVWLATKIGVLVSKISEAAKNRGLAADLAISNEKLTKAYARIEELKVQIEQLKSVGYRGPTRPEEKPS